MGLCILEDNHISFIHTLDLKIVKGDSRTDKLVAWYQCIDSFMHGLAVPITDIVVEKQPKFSPCKALVAALPYWCIAWQVKLKVVCSSQVRKYFKCPEDIIKDTKKCKGWAKDLVEKDFLLFQETNKLLDHNACDALLMATMHTKLQLTDIFL